MERGEVHKERYVAHSGLPTEAWLIEVILTLAGELGVPVDRLASLGASIGDVELAGIVSSSIEPDDRLVTLRLKGGVVALRSERLDEWGWVCAESEYRGVKSEP